MPESGSLACEEFFTSDLSQTRKTVPHQHRSHWRERAPFSRGVAWMGQSSQAIAGTDKCRHTNN